jgi:hypothetical protein
MPLPSGDQPWPPLAVAKTYEKFIEWAAWYSGDPEQLKSVYATAESRPGSPSPWYRFWNRLGKVSPTGQQAAPLHVPFASDLSAYGASLLFGEPPQCRIQEAHEATEPPEGDTEPVKPAPANTAAGKCEDRLRELIEEGGMVNRLIEAAESASPFGGVYLYPAWDKTLRPWPILAIAQADNAIPVFRWGILASVLFHRILETTKDKKVWRHLELHEPGQITHGLYEGTAARLGEARNLSVRTETAGLTPTVTLPFDELDVEYVPNSRPNRLDRASDLGGSDYQGSEGFLDALDETYASWMRDIRLAKARIVVPRDFLGKEGKFHVDDEVYTPVDMDPQSAQKNGMLAHQFAIRFEEHQATIDGLILRMVGNAGYSPQTFGLMMRDGGTAEAAKALRIRENRTQLTLRRKGNWWGPAIARVQRHILLIDKEVFETPIEVFTPTVTMADSIMVDISETAATVGAIRSAEAGSDETLVAMLHPDWSEDEVQAEVARIADERKSSAPSPFEVGSGFGASPDAPEASPTPSDAGKLPETPEPMTPVRPNAPKA